MKVYDNSTHTASSPIWFGVGESDYYIGGAVYPAYGTSSKKITLGFINNSIKSDNTYEIIGNRKSIVWRKIRGGELQTGDKDYAKINLNGEFIDSRYDGSAALQRIYKLHK